MLEIYGIPVVKYKGKCKLISKAETEVRGRFEIVQLNDGSIYLYAKISKKQQLNNWPKFQDFSTKNINRDIQRIVGVLDDGRILETNGVIHLVRVSDFLSIGNILTKLVFHIQSFSVFKKGSKHRRKRFRFYLTNLLFVGVDWHWQIKNRVGYRKTEINLKNTIFTLFPMPEYKTLSEELRATKKCRLTCHVDVKPSRKSKESILDLTDKLCLLLS